MLHHVESYSPRCHVFRSDLQRFNMSTLHIWLMSINLPIDPTFPNEMSSNTGFKSSPGSDIGIGLLPNQRHRIVSRKGGVFTLMVVGTCVAYIGSSGLGKTTFINTLFSSLLKEHKKNERGSKEIERTVSIEVVQAGKLFDSCQISKRKGLI